MSDLQLIREGRAALRQMRSLARAECLTARDTHRLLAKVERAFILASRHDGLRAARHLGALVKTGTITDRLFEEQAKTMSREFEAVLGADKEPRAAPAFHLIAGGRP